MSDDLFTAEFGGASRRMTTARIPDSHAAKGGLFFCLKVYQAGRLSIECADAAGRLVGSQTPTSKGNTR